MYQENKKIHKINDFNVIEYDKSNIYIIEDILNNTFCDEIIKLINKLPLNFLKVIKGNNVECNICYINDLIKKNDELYYIFTTNQEKYLDILNNKISIYTNKLNGVKNRNIVNYNNEINEIMITIKNIMEKINGNIIFDQNSGYMLRKIYGETYLHSDNIHEKYTTNINYIKENKTSNVIMVRNSSIIFALNDDYDGGYFNFPYYDIKFKLKKGSVLIFPPYWTHPHSVDKVENNTFRYTISTWSCMNI